MLGFSWSQLILIGVVALVILGPEDMPKLFRTLGRAMARARSMAQEFTSAMEDAAKGSGLDEAATGMKEFTSLRSKNSRGLDALDRAVTKFEKWDPKTDLGKQLQPDPGAPPPAGKAAVTVDPAPEPVQQPDNCDGLAPLLAQQATPKVVRSPHSRRRLAAVRRSKATEM